MLAKLGGGLEPNRGFSSWFVHTPALPTASTIPCEQEADVSQDPWKTLFSY